MNIVITECGLDVFTDKSIYNLDVLHKCFYWYGANYDVAFSDFNSQLYKVELISKYDGLNFDETASKIKRDLVDFKVRDAITKETQTIRELIVAKAFAYYDDGTTPLTELSDPVGFDPLSI